MSLRAWFYIVGVLTTGIICVLVELRTATFVNAPWLTFGLLTILASLAQLFVVEDPTLHVAYAATPIFVFAAILLLPPWQLSALIIIYPTIEFAYERLRHGHRLPNWYIQPFNIASEVIAATAAWLIFHQGDALNVSILAGIIPVAVGALVALVFVTINHVLLGLALMLARGKRWRETGMLRPANVVSDLILLLLGYVVAVLWTLNPWLVLPALSPLALMYRALRVPTLEHEAQTDVKTNLLNARYFTRRFEEEFARMGRFQRPLTLIMADIDFLRTVNNTYGHVAGDVVISGVGRIIAQNIREYDFAGRFGGEEFAIVLPETSSQDGMRFAERMRAAVEAARFIDPGSDQEIRITMSFGVASHSIAEHSPTELMRVADQALYAAKSGGRNRVHGQLAPAMESEITALHN